METENKGIQEYRKKAFVTKKGCKENQFIRTYVCVYVLMYS
jgi:hypothetical protein